MNNEKDRRPDCFGDLEKVFPMTDKGLRQTPDDCYYYCEVKTKCLRKALGNDGEKVEEEIIDRGAKAGVINFFERWSRKKQLYRKKQKK